MNYKKLLYRNNALFSEQVGRSSETLNRILNEFATVTVGVFYCY